MNRDFYYVTIDRDKNQIFTCGAKFSEFIEFITNKPTNIVLMQAQFWAGKWNGKIGYEYVDQENMKELLTDDVYNYGNFRWIDYDNKDNIYLLTPQEEAELLYLAHKCEPLYSPFFDKLNNQYVYLAHDDEYWTKIFMKDIDDYRKVIEGKIIKAFKGRRKHIEPIPNEILDILFTGAEKGIIINFPDIYRNDKSVGVRVYRVGKYMNYDKIHDVFNRKVDCFSNHIIIEYSRNKWKTYMNWK